MNVADYLKQFPSGTNYLTLPQHESWIKTKRSDVTGMEYQYNEIELVEELMEHFQKWSYNIVSKEITQDKTGVAVTIQVELTITAHNGVGSFVGIASEWAPSLKSLPLITPKCASMAFKNAARKIGRLFGKDLNRGLENNELPVVQVEDKSSTTANLIKAIKSCKTTEQLLTYQIVAKHNAEAWDEYQSKFSELISSKSFL
jgi:hypothetical protein